MNTVSKKDLARTLAAAHPGVFATIAYAEAAVDAVFNGISVELGKGSTVRVHKFGDFSISTTKARPGRNPRTGEAIALPESKRVKFKASKQLRTVIG